jgi:hypothetical protein
MKRSIATILGKGHSVTTSFRVRKSALRPLVRGGTEFQTQLDKSIDTGEAWLQLNRMLQNITGNGKGIATMVGSINTKDVFVKVQMADNARSKYDIEESLKLHNLHGFAQFHCIFTCDGDASYIEQFGQNELTNGQPVCRGKGGAMGVILMPFYSKGSLETFLKNDRSPSKVIGYICTIIENYFNAFVQTSYIHGDYSPKI